MKWISANDQLPTNTNPVLASDGKVSVRAFFAPKFTIEDDNEYGAAEYSEEKYEYYLKEGWYEQNQHDEICWMVDGVTHWMPLPEPPGQDTK